VVSDRAFDIVTTRQPQLDLLSSALALGEAMKFKFLFVVAIVLCGCSSTPGDLEKSTSAVRDSKNYTENYQEVYRRFVGTARRCSTSTGSHVSFEVDADLYSELGYG